MHCFGLLVCAVFCVAAKAQHIYDGRNGPHVFGTPGNQVYIRGQKEGTYTLPGVGGQFKLTSSPREHVYTDEQGNTYLHRKNGGPGTHTISGPGPAVPLPRPVHRGAAYEAQRRPRSAQFHVERPGRTVDVGPGGIVVQRDRRSPQFHVERPGRTVDVGAGGFVIQRDRRSLQFNVERPDQAVDFRRIRRSSQFHVERPGRTVDVGSGGIVAQRSSRSIEDARVQGENFVAHDD